jgi:Chlorite dismutase
MVMKPLMALLILSFAVLGCDLFGEREKEIVAINAKEVAKESGAKTKKKPEDVTMTKESAWTWGYFFAAEDKASVQGLAGGRQQSLTLYRVDKIVSIRGKPAVNIAPGSKIVRVETASRLPSTGAGKTPSLLFHGVPQHLQYTSQAQRDDLNRRARAEIPPSKDTVAVVIPIRKSAAWWAMAHDQRHAHFQKKDGKIGHTAIGAEYVERIYRKLYHTRYAVETTDHDFITYFEFARAHEDDFKSLCAKLRDPQRNPEWDFVDREYEIWMTKME